jgi:hypothetical protein
LTIINLAFAFGEKWARESATWSHQVATTQADLMASESVVLVSTQMKNHPYQGLSAADRKIVELIATAIANGNLLPNNRHSPLAARRVFDALKKAWVMHWEEDRFN